MPGLYAEMSSVRPPRIFWPLLSLSIVLPVYGVVALVLNVLGAGDSFSMLYLAAPLAVLLVGLPAWWHFVVKPRRATIRRGMRVGALTGIIAHPVMWIACIPLMGMTTHLSPQAFVGAVSQSLFWVPLGTLISLVAVGWLTFLLGGVIGLLLIYFQRALTYASQPRAIRKAAVMRRLERSNIEQILKEIIVEEGSIDDKSEHREVNSVS